MTDVRILAGPILRRTDTNQVCVWIATSCPVSVVGYVYDADALVNRQLGYLAIDPAPIGSGADLSLYFGEHLHVTLVRIHPHTETSVERFPERTTLAYDLEINPGEAIGKAQSLASFFPTSGRDRICYPPHRLPTFVIRSGFPLDFLQGSCRKIHGEDHDALALADTAIERGVQLASNRAYSSAAKAQIRPDRLFLTGDQIYADDVAEPLIDHIASLAPTLMGFDEITPRGGSISGSGRCSYLQCGMRGDLVTAGARPGEKSFTSSYARNHLIGIGEFAAMYLLAWSPELWPRELPRQPKCPRSDVPDYAVQLAAAEGFRFSLPRVRRALANVIVYMIFDDHEITDDWNRTGRWKAQVLAAPLGRRIISNGLAAFWAFQAWGNDPDRFEPLPLEEALKKKEPGLSEVADLVLERGHWGYFIPGHPLTVVLDERTKRGFDGLDDAPWRIAQTQMYDLFQEIGGRFRPGELLILVAPAPVLNLFLWDTGQGILSLFAADEYDAESWFGNVGAFGDLMFRIARLEPRCCLILSGDVHYAYVATAELRNEPVSGLTTPLVQFTSSALKNPQGALPVRLGSRDRGIVSFPFRYQRLGERLVFGGPELHVRLLGAEQSREPTAIASSNLGRVRVKPSMLATLDILTPRRGSGSVGYSVSLARDPNREEWHMALAD